MARNSTMGRPRLFTPEIGRTFCNYVRSGIPVKQAAYLTGPSYQSFLNWQEEGEKQKNGKLRVFFDDLEQAKAEYLGRHISNVNQCAFGYDQVTVRTFAKTVYEEVITKYPDGRVETRRIPHQVTDMETSKTHVKDGKLSMEALGRRDPENWSNRQKLEHSTEEGNPFIVQVISGVSMDDL